MSAPDPIERELKVSTRDAPAAIRTIEAAGAALVLPRHWERNWVLDRAEELLRARSLLRVRDRWSEAGDALGAVVTVKRPLETPAASGGIKEQHEHETTVANAAAAIQVFSQLDYRIARRYHKARTAWRLDDHEIVLDETPIGPWIEIEGPEPARLALLLGLPDRGDLRNYLSIYDAHRAQRLHLPEDMVFVDVAGDASEPVEVTPPGFEGVQPDAAGRGPEASQDPVPELERPCHEPGSVEVPD